MDERPLYCADCTDALCVLRGPFQLAPGAARRCPCCDSLDLIYKEDR